VINAWLELSTIPLFALLILFYGSSAALISWLCFGSPLKKPIQTLVGVVAPFFGAAGILFALLTGFLASDVGDRNRQAWRAVHAEGSAAASIYTLSIASISDMAAIRERLRDYLQSVITDEWPHMNDHGASSKTETALSMLLTELSDPKIAAEAGQAVHTALMNSALRARDARADRLSLAWDRTNDLKWTIVLILGVITQIAIGLVHLERPRAQVAALVVFSTAAVITLGLIALQEQPFAGPIRTSPEPIEQVLRPMAR
jgi:hypothetical protein